MDRNVKFDNVISLGYWCGPALELRRIHRRAASYPFDWLITDFPEVLRLMDTNFDDFCSYDNLAQYADNPGYYCDVKHNVHYYHDFDRYTALEAQIHGVQEKYKRRIERLYRDTQKPTLFIRYVRGGGECIYILENYEKILRTIRQNNGRNEILFVGNKSLQDYQIPNFYGGEVPEGKNVIDDFLESIDYVKDYIVNSTELKTPYIGKKQSMAAKIHARLKAVICKPYVHTRRYAFKA